MKKVKIQGNVDSTMNVLDNDGYADAGFDFSGVAPGHVCAIPFKFGATAGSIGKKIPAGHKFRVLETVGLKTVAGGGAGASVQVKKNITAMTDDLAIDAVNAIIRHTTIDPAQATLDGDAGDSLLVTTTAGGKDPTCDLFVKVMRLAY